MAQPLDRRIAIVGAGPAGIAAAARLARAGIGVVYLPHRVRYGL